MMRALARLSPQNLARRVRDLSWVDRWVAWHGPATRKLPRALRRRAVAQEAVPRLPSATTWPIGKEELVRPAAPTVAGVSSLALRPHRLRAPFVAQLGSA